MASVYADEVHTHGDAKLAPRTFAGSEALAGEGVFPCRINVTSLCLSEV